MKFGLVHYLGTAAVVGAVAFGAYVYSPPKNELSDSGGTSTIVPALAASNVDEARPADAKGTAMQPTASAPSNGLSARYASLASSGKPADAFAAYNLAMDCVWARQSYQQADLQPLGERTPETKAALADGTLLTKASEACGDLTDSQIRGRLKYAEAAAAAGVPMAALRLSAEGPFGDPSALANRADDPAVREWRQRVASLIKLAADKGDVTAMSSLSNMYESGTGIIGQKDPYKALEYATAKWELQRQLTGVAPPFQEKLSAKLASALTPEQAQAARESGYRIAAMANSGSGK